MVSSCLFLAILTVTMVIVCNACKNGKIYDNTVTQDDINEILTVHNEFRATVANGWLENQPPAQNMQKMTWNDEIARRAQNWADQCTFQHDGISSRGENTGQNIFIIYYSGPHSDRKHNFTSAIQSWYSEHVYYTYKELKKGDSNDPKTQTGHYTQVIWAKTNTVGCGFTFFYHTKKKEDHILYVCNYAPAGNYIDQYPYKEGKPDCKGNGMSNSDIDGLCKK